MSLMIIPHTPVDFDKTNIHIHNNITKPSPVIHYVIWTLVHDLGIFSYSKSNHCIFYFEIFLVIILLNSLGFFVPEHFVISRFQDSSRIWSQVLKC